MTKVDILYRIQSSHDKGATWLNVGGPYTDADEAVRDAESGLPYARACGMLYCRVVALSTDVVRQWGPA